MGAYVSNSLMRMGKIWWTHLSRQPKTKEGFSGLFSWGLLGVSSSRQRLTQLEGWPLLPGTVGHSGHRVQKAEVEAPEVKREGNSSGQKVNFEVEERSIHHIHCSYFVSIAIIFVDVAIVVVLVIASSFLNFRL